MRVGQRAVGEPGPMVIVLIPGGKWVRRPTRVHEGHLYYNGGRLIPYDGAYCTRLAMLEILQGGKK